MELEQWGQKTDGNTQSNGDNTQTTVTNTQTTPESNVVGNKINIVWNCIFGENFSLRYIVPLLHEQKLSEIDKVKIDDTITPEHKKKFITSLNVRYEQHIKDIQLQYKQITRQFYDVARHPSVVSFVELGTDLYCDLSVILQRRIDFSEKVVKEKYKAALIEENENGDCVVDGKKCFVWVK